MLRTLIFRYSNATSSKEEWLRAQTFEFYANKIQTVHIFSPRLNHLCWRKSFVCRFQKRKKKKAVFCGAHNAGIHLSKKKKKSPTLLSDSGSCVWRLQLVRVAVRESQPLDALLDALGQVRTLLLIAWQGEAIVVAAPAAVQHGVWVGLQVWPLVVGERHGEERLRVAHKLVDVSLASHLLGGCGRRGVNNVCTRRIVETRQEWNRSNRVCSFAGKAAVKYLLFEKDCKSWSLINKCSTFWLVGWREIHLKTVS